MIIRVAIDVSSDQLLRMHLLGENKQHEIYCTAELIVIQLVPEVFSTACVAEQGPVSDKTTHTVPTQNQAKHKFWKGINRSDCGAPPLQPKSSGFYPELD